MNSLFPDAGVSGDVRRQRLYAELRVFAAPYDTRPSQRRELLSQAVSSSNPSGLGVEH